jgi:hypothetical protein
MKYWTILCIPLITGCTSRQCDDTYINENLSPADKEMIENAQKDPGMGGYYVLEPAPEYVLENGAMVFTGGKRWVWKQAK